VVGTVEKKKAWYKKSRKKGPTCVMGREGRTGGKGLAKRREEERNRHPEVAYDTFMGEERVWRSAHKSRKVLLGREDVTSIIKSELGGQKPVRANLIANSKVRGNP